MNEDLTFIKLYRKAAESELFSERPFDRWHAFEYLLINARRFPKDVIIKGQRITLDVGQLICGMEILGDKWGWSRGKVQRFLNLLEKMEMIEKKPSQIGTIITIKNYKKYQCDSTAGDTSESIEKYATTTTSRAHNKSSDDTTDSTTDGTGRKKDKKDNNIYNNKNARAREGFVAPTLEEVQAYCAERNNSVDAQRFVDYYTANGWMVGRNKMKNWQAAVRTWERQGTAENVRHPTRTQRGFCETPVTDDLDDLF